MYVGAPVKEANGRLRREQAHFVGHVKQVHGQALRSPPTLSMSVEYFRVLLLVMMLAGEARVSRDVDAQDLVSSNNFDFSVIERIWNSERFGIFGLMMEERK